MAGQDLMVAQVLPPANSSSALAVIPSGRLYDPVAGLPGGMVNSGVLNDSLSLSGATLQRESYPQDNAIVRAFDRAFGTSLAAQARTQAALRQQAAQAANGATTTQNMVQHAQDTIDANQAANSTLWGWYTGPNAVQEIWNFSSSQNYFQTSVDQLDDAQSGGALLMSQILLRLATSVNFLVLYIYAEASRGFPDVENLNAAQPALKPHAQSVLDFLNATLPGYPWEENHNGTGLVGMDWLSSGDGITRTYYWSPPAPSLDDIYHLWDYTPSSGPPTRNGIDDLASLLAIVPFIY